MARIRGNISKLMDMDDPDIGNLTLDDIGDSDELDFPEYSDAESAFNFCESDNQDDSDDSDTLNGAIDLPLPPLPPSVERPTFQHQPLARNSIRLLEVKPGLDNDDLRCVIHHVRLDQHPRYIALSYRWGTTDERTVLSVGPDTLEIMPNAYWALFYQRRMMQRSLIWIDCICIDQNNVEERNHQVSLMARIFSEAIEVLVWLGIPSKPLEDALRFIQRSEALDEHKGKLNMGDALRAMEPVFKLEYWTRIWIIQEILFAQRLTIFVGNRQLSWSQLESMVIPLYQWLKTRAETKAEAVSFGLAQSMEVVKAVHRLVKQRRKGYGAQIRNFRGFLLGYQRSQCSDVRDRIYGLAKIWNKQASVPFVPDYAKNVFEVLLTTFAYILQHDGGIDTLGVCKDLLRILDLCDSQTDMHSQLEGCIRLLKLQDDSSTFRFRYKYELCLRNGESLSIPHFTLDSDRAALLDVRPIAMHEDLYIEVEKWYLRVIGWSPRAVDIKKKLQEAFQFLSKVNSMLVNESLRRGTSTSFEGYRMYIDTHRNPGLASSTAKAGDACRYISSTNHGLFYPTKATRVRDEDGILRAVQENAIQYKSHGTLYCAPMFARARPSDQWEREQIQGLQPFGSAVGPSRQPGFVEGQGLKPIGNAVWPSKQPASFESQSLRSIINVVWPDSQPGSFGGQRLGPSGSDSVWPSSQTVLTTVHSQPFCDFIDNPIHAFDLAYQSIKLQDLEGEIIPE